MNEEEDENASTPKSVNNLSIKVDASKEETNSSSSTTILEMSKNDITPV